MTRLRNVLLQFFLAVVLFLISNIPSFSQTYKFQSGVCYNNEGLQIRGYFLDDNPEKTSSKINFQEILEGPTVELLPQAFSKVNFDNGTTLISFYDSINKAYIFARQLEWGKVSLYKYFLNKQQHFIVEKDESKYLISDYKLNSNGQEIKSTTYKGVLNYLLGSSKDALEKINRIRFREVEIRDVIFRFNKTQDENLKRLKNKKVTEFLIAAGLAVNSNQINTKFTDAGQSSPNSGFSFSFSYGYFIDKRFKLVAGIGYQQFPSTLNSKEPSSSITSIKKFTINTVELPLQLQYNFLKKKSLTASLSAAINGGIVVQDRYTLESSLASRSGTFNLDLSSIKNGYCLGLDVFYRRVGAAVNYYTDRFSVNGEQAVLSTGIRISGIYRFGKSGE